MKIIKMFIFSAISFFLYLIPLSAQDYGRAGCGPGTLFIKSNSGWAQVLVSTTNRGMGWSYTSTSSDLQVIAILAGTSNCNQNGIVRNDKAQEVFVHLNYDSLEQEIASGKGEKLDTLATLFGCSKNKSEFATMTKKSYKKLFSKENNDPSKLYLALRTEIQNNKSLKQSCQL